MLNQAFSRSSTRELKCIRRGEGPTPSCQECCGEIITGTRDCRCTTTATEVHGRDSVVELVLDRCLLFAFIFIYTSAFLQLHWVGTDLVVVFFKLTIATIQSILTVLELTVNNGHKISMQ